MKQGDASHEVEELQKFLNVKVTGYFGPLTKKAVADFQYRNNLKMDGIVGAGTRAKLNEGATVKMAVSQAGIDMIKSYERLHDANKATLIVEPMRDPIGLPTIGWGSRYDLNGLEVTMSTKPITLADCDALLKRDVGYIGAELNKYVLTQNQFDALTSLCYNIGLAAFRKSTIAKKLASRQPVLLENFTAYNKARNKTTKLLEVLPGLTIRRKKEFALFSKI